LKWWRRWKTVILLLDNYDSFTYNVYQLLSALGAEVEVIRHDKITVEGIERGGYEALVISPGPGEPKDAGITEEAVRKLGPRMPILGICLGHQAIGEAFGARLENFSDVFHGVATPCRITADDPLFAGLPAAITVGRYHSWVVSKEGFPDCLEITAESDQGQIMALRHRDYDIRGIQFHPESVLTPDGRTMIGNWLNTSSAQ
jgi:anthranilate synthase component 2